MKSFAIFWAAIVVFIYSENALSQVYYMNTEGDVSSSVKINLSGEGPVDVIAILDEGTNVDRIIDINQNYNDYFNFVNPIAASGKYSVLFSISSTDDILERYKNSSIPVNRKSFSSGIMANNKSCFIRIVYDEARNLIAYNMYVLDGTYSSYEDCLEIYYDEFLKMTR